jgi:hypothetical protein
VSLFDFGFEVINTGLAVKSVYMATSYVAIFQNSGDFYVADLDGPVSAAYATGYVVDAFDFTCDGISWAYGCWISTTSLLGCGTLNSGMRYIRWDYP